MTDSQRLEQVINYLGLTPNAISKVLGLSSPQAFYDIRKGKHGISKYLSAKIQEKYPNINPAWLLTGIGEMIKEPDFSEKMTEDVKSGLHFVAGNSAENDDEMNYVLVQLSETVHIQQQNIAVLIKNNSDMTAEVVRIMSKILEIIERDRNFSDNEHKLK